MKLPTILLIFMVSCISVKKTSPDPITVAVYYFPNYHTNDSRNIINKGHGWSEWELVKSAKPRFPGHQQANVPNWGYTDEKDPKVMAQKITNSALWSHIRMDKCWLSVYEYNQHNTPENFKKALEITREKLLSDPSWPRIMNINCWNE